MTAVILNLASEQVILAMDTLAVTSETKSPFFFTTKFYRKRPGIPSCAAKPVAIDAATNPQSHSPAASAGE